jgi:hypothetical protein
MSSRRSPATIRYRLDTSGARHTPGNATTIEVLLGFKNVHRRHPGWAPAQKPRTERTDGASARPAQHLAGLGHIQQWDHVLA